MDQKSLRELLAGLIQLPKETEWVEFKHNWADPNEIGEYLSALSNAAALHKKSAGYIVWGVQDETHKVLGTSFSPKSERHKGQELEHWLSIMLSPRVEFRIHEFDYQEKRMALIEVSPAPGQPVSFAKNEFIRIGSYKKLLREYPEKERALWQIFSTTHFESVVAMAGIVETDVSKYLAYSEYFKLTEQQQPTDLSAMLERLCGDNLIAKAGRGRYDILNLGAILFARQIQDFERLSRKALRVIFYQGENRTEAKQEQGGTMGYAVGINRAINFLTNRLPQSEEIREAFRASVPLYPPIAVRELLANALVHQDFSVAGTGPMVEVFSDRVEITNPGKPLIDPNRFMDLPPLSRNERLTSLMRRMNICEERGSGIDKVIFHIEMHQLPPPEFRVSDNHTQVVLFAPRKLNQMDQSERVRACYQHACLQHCSNKKMSNETLRTRLGIGRTNYPMASRIIKDAKEAGLVKQFGNTSGKYARYVPYWA